MAKPGELFGRSRSRTGSLRHVPLTGAYLA